MGVMVAWGDGPYASGLAVSHCFCYSFPNSGLEMLLQAKLLLRESPMNIGSRLCAAWRQEAGASCQGCSQAGAWEQETLGLMRMGDGPMSHDLGICRGTPPTATPPWVYYFFPNALRVWILQWGLFFMKLVKPPPFPQRAEERMKGKTPSIPRFLPAFLPVYGQHYRSFPTYGCPLSLEVLAHAIT